MSIITDRLRIFDRSGMLKREFSASVKRSWVIGAKGTASFKVGVDKAYCSEDILQFGNWVLVENSIGGNPGFPPWIGTIGSREWSGRFITVAAFSPEFLMSQRIGQSERTITGAPGVIFKEIINQTNYIEGTLLTIGNVYADGMVREETITPQRLDADLKRIHERSREEYIWRPVVDKRLIVYCDWTQKLGNELDFTFWESKKGGNIEARQRVLVEDAPEANYIMAYGGGVNWASRMTGLQKDDSSIDKYGLIQRSIQYYDVSEAGTLLNNAADELKVMKNPACVYDIYALDVGDTLKNIALGNRMDIKFQNIGFSNNTLGTQKRVRIIGLYYEPDKRNQIECAVQEI